jgi:hypothetical protein
MQMNSKILYCLIRSSYTTNYSGQPLDDLSEDLFSWQNLPICSASPSAVCSLCISQGGNLCM